MQLVTPSVSMYDSMKDKQISIPEVIEKWGVPPEKMIDVQSLTGDSTDNVRAFPASARKRRRNCWKSLAISTRFWPAPLKSSRTSAARTFWLLPTRRRSRANW